MKTYMFLTKETAPEFEELVSTSTTDICRELFKVSGSHSVVFIDGDWYNDILSHPAFRYTTSIACPLARAFLMDGKWFCDKNQVSDIVFKHFLVSN